jgi:hypothetical protein
MALKTIALGTIILVVSRPSENPNDAQSTLSTGALRVFGNKPFMRFARKFGASCADLWEMCHRPPEADLGSHVFKFRLAREGEGKSGGARTIVAMKEGDRAVMIFGYEKKDMSNITAKELQVLKKLASHYLGRSTEELNKLVTLKDLEECLPPK